MNVATVVQQGKCLTCGLCKSICPVKAICLEYDKMSGFYYPTVDENSCINCGLCKKKCPSINQTMSGEKTILGNYQRIVLGHSNNLQVRNDSTSGGVVNELIQYLIDKEIVDAALVVEKNNQSPIGSWYKIITKENVHELKEKTRSFASRYVMVPVLEGLSEINLKKTRIAVVGTPCQIRALHGLEKESIIKIGITCSGGMSYLATKEYMRQQKLKGQIYYRGDGWPGKNLLFTDEQQIEYQHNGSPFENIFSSQIFKNSNCKYCEDHFAECSDISFCDYWNTDEIKNEHVGNSCVIIRNEFMSDIVKNMQTEGKIEIVKELNPQEVINGQLNVLKVKKGNAQNQGIFRLFSSVIWLINKSGMYKLLGQKQYRLISKMYKRICARGKIIVNDHDLLNSR